MLNYYLIELKAVGKYFFFSIFFSLIIFFQKFSLIFIFFYYPISKVVKKKLLILNTLDLINISLLLGLITIFLVSSITFSILLKIFFSNSWYSTQIKIFKRFFLKGFLSVVISVVIFYFVQKIIFNLSLIWTFETFNSFSLFEIQLQIIDFIKFQICSLSVIYSVLIYSVLIYSVLKSFLTWRFIFFHFKNLRKLIFFMFLCFYVLILPEFNLVFCFVFFYIFISEIIFFYICLKLKRLKF